MLRSDLQKLANRYGEPTTEGHLDFLEQKAIYQWSRFNKTKGVESREGLFRSISCNPRFSKRIAEEALAIMRGVRLAKPRKTLKLGNLNVQLCPRCLPTLSTSIFGKLNKTNKLMVHRLEKNKPCGAAEENSNYRTLALEWNRSAKQKAFSEFEIEVIDRIGIISELSQIVCSHGLWITRIRGDVSGPGARVLISVFAGKENEINLAYADLEKNDSVVFIRKSDTRLAHRSYRKQGFTLLESSGQHFTGRSVEFKKTKEALINNSFRGVLIRGPKRIGKTSFMLESCRRIQRDIEDLIVVKTHGAGIKPLNLTTVMHSLYKNMIDALPKELLSLWVPYDVNPALDDLNELRNRVIGLLEKMDSHYSLVLLTFDETACLLKWAGEDGDANAFWGMLGDWLERFSHVRLLLTAIPTKIDSHSPNISHVFSRCYPIDLNVLSLEEARELLRKGGRISGFKLSSVAEGLGAELAGRHPYYLNILGMFLNPEDTTLGLFPKKPFIDFSDVENVANHFSGKLQVNGAPALSQYFYHFWNEISANLKDTIYRISEHFLCHLPSFYGKASLVKQFASTLDISNLGLRVNDLKALEERGLISLEKGSSNVILTVPLLGLWLTGSSGPGNRTLGSNHTVVEKVKIETL